MSSGLFLAYSSNMKTLLARIGCSARILSFCDFVIVSTMSFFPRFGLNGLDLWDEMSTPLALMTSIVSSVGGVPSKASSPAESTVKLEMSLSPMSFLAKPSAMGLLHALAEQTKSIFMNLEGGT